MIVKFFPVPVVANTLPVAFSTTTLSPALGVCGNTMAPASPTSIA